MIFLAVSGRIVFLRILTRVNSFRKQVGIVFVYSTYMGALVYQVGIAEDSWSQCHKQILELHSYTLLKLKTLIGYK